MSCGPDTDVVPRGLFANLKKVVNVTRRSLRRGFKIPGMRSWAGAPASREDFTTKSHPTSVMGHLRSAPWLAGVISSPIRPR